MTRTPAKQAFTLIELAVVLAVIGLLASITLPGMVGARLREAQTACLANLGKIAAASLVYAAEDPREQIVPMMWMKVRKEHSWGFGDIWSWRTALPFAYGGRTPSAEFPGIAYPTILMDPWFWGACRRPLNPYLYSVPCTPYVGERSVFHCPADVGYPDLDPDDWGGGCHSGLDWPPEAAGIPCYDFLGNSYRINTAGLVWLQGLSLAKASFTSSPEGHTASSLAGPLSENVLYSEPLFYFLSRALFWADPGVDPIKGWHGRLNADNVAYCDGSARMTEIGELYEFTDEELDEMGVTFDFGWQYFLRRGPTWQMDCYPTPGALIMVFDESGDPLMYPWDLSYYSGWPFDKFQYNEPP